MPISLNLNTGYGIIALALVGIIVIVLAIILYKLISKLNIKYKDLELNQKNIETNQRELSENIKASHEQIEMLSREALRKQLDFMRDAVMSHENLLCTTILNHYRLTTPEATETRTIIRLLIRFLLAQIVTRLTGYLTDNHVGNNKTELANYCKLRSTQLANYVREFFSKNAELIPGNINISDVFKGTDNSDYEFIYKNLLEILINCKLLSKTVLNPSDTELENQLLGPIETL